MTSKRRIAHKEWLTAACDSYVRKLQLVLDNRCPEVLEVGMLVTPIQHNLRCILGKSNVGCAWWLLWRSIYTRWIETPWYALRHPIKYYRICREAAEMDDEEES